MGRRIWAILLVLIALLPMAGCAQEPEEPVVVAEPPPPDPIEIFLEDYTAYSQQVLTDLELGDLELVEAHWQTYCYYQQTLEILCHQLILDGRGQDVTDLRNQIALISNTLFPAMDFWPQTVHGSPKEPYSWLCRTRDGIVIRQVWIDRDLQEPITIGHLTDLHFNYCDQVDFAQNDPVLMSTYQMRRFMANGASVANAERCLEYTAACDQVIITGDVLDYLSHGTLTLLEEVIWTPYPETLVTLGNHEPCIRMQGELPEVLTIEERYELLKAAWEPHHDPIYTSRLIRDAVLVIQLDNSQMRYEPELLPLLQQDLQLAREMGYTVLLFQHVPLWSNNPMEKQLPASYYTGYPFIDLYTDGMGYGAKEGSATDQVYDLITANSDIIAGIFCGHEHGVFTSQILCPDGSVIPQYIQTGTCYNKGHVLQINIQ